MAIVGLEWIVVIAVVVLLFFGGGKKISEFARNLGRATGEFQKGKQEIDKEIQNARDIAKETKKAITGKE